MKCRVALSPDSVPVLTLVPAGGAGQVASRPR
jgi:hypothetical protein